LNCASTKKEEEQKEKDEKKQQKTTTIIEEAKTLPPPPPPQIEQPKSFAKIAAKTPIAFTAAAMANKAKASSKMTTTVK
jgi:hypothetical protein